MQELPSLAVSAFQNGYRPVSVGIINHIMDGKLLMVRSIASSREWLLPQGEIYPGERPTDALYRALRDKLAIGRDEVVLDRFVSFADVAIGSGHSDRSSDRRGALQGTRYFFFRLRYTGIEPFRLDESEIAEVRWVRLSEAAALFSGLAAEGRVLMATIALGI